MLLLFSVTGLAVLLVVGLEGREEGTGELEEECREGRRDGVNISSPRVVERGGGTPEACQYIHGESRDFSFCFARFAPSSLFSSALPASCLVV